MKIAIGGPWSLEKKEQAWLDCVFRTKKSRIYYEEE
jgi:hypothetical protein